MDIITPKHVTEILEEYGVIHPRSDYPAKGDEVPDAGTTVGIDRAFVLHAGFGLLWNVLAYLEMCHVHSKKLHKLFGYFSSLCFAGHISASAFTVFMDVVWHTTIPKFILLLI